MTRRFGSSLRLRVLGVLLVLLGGCYSFTGGGLPSHVRTVAILPFDNQTSEPALTQEVAAAVRVAMEQRLGLRSASEETADAVVRGSITRYLADVPLSFQQTGVRDVTVTRRLVQITVTVEIIDQREDAPLWQRAGLRVEGEYQPPEEQVGRVLALERLVVDIVDGAQSQW